MGAGGAAAPPDFGRSEGAVGSGAPWARATNNAKKPQSQMCQSFRKLDLRFL